jgi:hypothetical protein
MSTSKITYTPKQLNQLKPSSASTASSTGETKNNTSSNPTIPVPIPTTDAIAKGAKTSKHCTIRLKHRSAAASTSIQPFPKKALLRSSSVQLEWVYLGTDNQQQQRYHHPLDPKHIIYVTSIPSLLIQAEFVPREYKNVHDLSHSVITIPHWLKIYSYLQPTLFQRIGFRSSCRLFNNVEKMITNYPNSSPLIPLPKCICMSYPHRNHSTLQSAIRRLKQEVGSCDTPVQVFLFIANGIHDEGTGIGYLSSGNNVVLDFPISIIGSDRNQCIFRGSFHIKSNDVLIKRMTIRESKRWGVKVGRGGDQRSRFKEYNEEQDWNHSGTLDNVLIDECAWNGVEVCGKCELINTEIRNSGKSGLCLAEPANITIDGKNTLIHFNCQNTSVPSSVPSYAQIDYGIRFTPADYGSRGVPFGGNHGIQLTIVSPLAFETHANHVSTCNFLSYNGGGGNCQPFNNESYQVIASKEEVLSCVDSNGRLHIKPGTFARVLPEAKKQGIQCFYFEDGDHDLSEQGIQTWYLDFEYSISIVGQSRENCILHGLQNRFYGGEEIDYNISDITIHGGVSMNEGASLILENVLVDQSTEIGVSLTAGRRNRMINCEITNSKWAGLCLYEGAKLSIEGETCIHHNLQNPSPSPYKVPGQMVYSAHDLFGVYADSTSTITIGKGLTKQLISFQNVQQRGLYRKDIDVNEGHRELTDGKNWYEEIQEDEIQEDVDGDEL